MAELQVGGKTLVTQTGTNNPVLGSTVNVNSALTGATFPAGHVVQVVPFQSSAGTNVLTANTDTPIAASKKSIIIKTNNPLILYVCDLTYESDNNTGYIFYTLQYAINSDSNYSFVHTNHRTMGTLVDNTTASGDTTVTYYHQTTEIAGTEIYYQVIMNKDNASSIYYNQQELGGQPSGSSNYCGGFIMEIQQ